MLLINVQQLRDAQNVHCVSKNFPPLTLLEVEKIERMPEKVNYIITTVVTVRV